MASNESSPFPLLLRFTRAGVLQYASDPGHALLPEIGGGVGAPAAPPWQRMVVQVFQQNQPRTLAQPFRETALACRFIPEPARAQVHVVCTERVSATERAAAAAREQAERTLRNQRDFALQVMKSMGQGLILANPQGQIQFVNLAAAGMLDFSPADMVGKSLLHFAPENEHAKLKAAHQELARGNAQEFTAHLRRRDGAPLYALLNSVPHLQKGQPQGAITVMVDLSNLLDFSEPETGELAVDSADFSLETVVGETVEALAAAAQQKGLALMTFIDPALPPILRGDPARLQQVLSKCLDAALQLTKTGETLVQASLAEGLSSISPVKSRRQ